MKWHVMIMPPARSADRYRELGAFAIHRKFSAVNEALEIGPMAPNHKTTQSKATQEFTERATSKNESSGKAHGYTHRAERTLLAELHHYIPQKKHDQTEKGVESGHTAAGSGDTLAAYELARDWENVSQYCSTN